MRADVGNLLVPEDDVQTNGSWAKHAIKSNGFVARKGESLLCDTRLMPIGEANSCYERVLSPLMRKNREFQDAALWAVLEGLGTDRNVVRPEERFDTPFKRLVRKLTLHATPKMVAEAEKMN
ncbi:MAG: hypothetical protein ABIG80_04525 [Patescibacteria group bacterium]